MSSTFSAASGISLVDIQALVGQRMESEAVQIFLLDLLDRSSSPTGEIIPIDGSVPSSSESSLLAHDEQVQAYHDAMYVTYPSLGFGLCCEPSGSTVRPGGSKATREEVLVESLDLYNPFEASQLDPGKAKKNSSKPSMRRFKKLPICVAIQQGSPAAVDATTKNDHESTSGGKLTTPTDERLNPLNSSTTFLNSGCFLMNAGTTGEDLVRHLGEPSKKAQPPSTSSGNRMTSASSRWEIEQGVWLEWENVGLHVVLKEDPEDVRKLAEQLEKATTEGEKKKIMNRAAVGAGGIWDRAARWKWSDAKVFMPTRKA